MQHDAINYLKDYSLKYIEMALITGHKEKVAHLDGCGTMIKDWGAGYCVHWSGKRCTNHFRANGFGIS